MEVRYNPEFGILLLTIILFTACASQRLYYHDADNGRDRFSREIMAAGRGTTEQLSAFLLQNNLDISPDYATYLAQLYIYEAGLEGVNHDIAFAQMCLETGFLKYRGVTNLAQNNFAGLGSVDSLTPGDAFPSAQMGVRAHIQHLKAYGCKDDLRKDPVDRRFEFVERGSAETIDQLEGRWSTDPDYAEKIDGMLTRLYQERKTGNAVK